MFMEAKEELSEAIHNVCEVGPEADHTNWMLLFPVFISSLFII